MTVVTGQVRDQPELPAEETRGGVRIVRVRSTTYDRSQPHLRAANYLTYLGRHGAHRAAIASGPTSSSA